MGLVSDDEGGAGRPEPQDGEYELWSSVDGSRDGVSHEAGVPWATKVSGCSHGRPLQEDMDEPGRMVPCEPLPGYRSDVPTTASGARRLLYAEAAGNPLQRDRRAFDDGISLLVTFAMPKESRAALLEAMAEIPGVEAVPRAETLTGDVGIAVGKEQRHSRRELIFDPETYAILGEREVVTDARAAHIPVGTVTAYSGVLVRAVVTEAGRRPDGSRLGVPVGGDRNG